MSAQSYFQHPLYQLAMQHFQQGEWRAGLTEVEHLIRLFPLERELHTLRNEFTFKEGLDHSEVGDQAIEGRRKARRLVLRWTVAIVVAAAAYLAVRDYSNWVVRQLAAARERVEYEIRIATLEAKRRDAEALIQVGRLAEAGAVLAEIGQLDPSFAGLSELSARLSAEQELADLYDQAMAQIEARNWLGAKASLDQLAARQPNYRDIAVQLTYIERQTLLGTLLSAGESAVARGDWEEAVAAFENMRALHPQHEPETIEAHLFESYVNAGRGVLIGQEDSLAALELAETYFRKALALRPQDPEVKRERELAGLYLQAQDDFDQGHWSQVVDGLEIVVAADPNYAQGTARQTLYEAYAARGEFQLATNLYEGALDDFERAAALAEQDTGAILRLYEAHLKVAEALGATGNYEAAVLHFRAAAELGNLAARGAEGNPVLLTALQEAERYAANGNFGVAYERYRRAVRLADDLQASVTHIVQEGEYLTLLASRYGSTVRAIALANGIENTNLIFPGQELIIPVLP